jgi:hypothetical protein
VKRPPRPARLTIVSRNSLFSITNDMHCFIQSPWKQFFDWPSGKSNESTSVQDGIEWVCRNYLS